MHYIELIEDRIIRGRTKNGLIVEGIFSIEEADKIASMFPDALTEMVYVKADRIVRLNRLIARHKISPNEAIKRMSESDAFRSQEGIDKLKEHTDIIITNNRGLNELFLDFEKSLLITVRKRLIQTLNQRAKKMAHTSHRSRVR
ncbi:MAG: hypothetical protein Q7S21_02290 [archaeon]|nr:hypothetical protein [archaeon]